MKPDITYKVIVKGFILLFVLACNTLVPLATATPLTIPSTSTSSPENQQPVISALSFNETSESPAYTINAQFPAMLDNMDPRTPAFNEVINKIVQGEIDAFKMNIAGIPTDPNFAASFFDVHYNLSFQNEELASIKFGLSGYTSGAAHPYHYTITVNYDFAQGRNLSLDELFLPGSNYLETISNYCIAELSQRDIGFDMFSEGAAPTPENYRNWNITSDGLMITFDEYQVAPYAAGAQTVVVPYPELQAAIDPQGPLGRISQ